MPSVCRMHEVQSFGLERCYYELKTAWQNGDRGTLSPEELARIGATETPAPRGGWREAAGLGALDRREDEDSEVTRGVRYLMGSGDERGELNV